MEKVIKARHWVKSYAAAASQQNAIWPYLSIINAFTFFFFFCIFFLHSLFDPAIPLLEVYSTDGCSHMKNDIRTMLVTVVLFATDWK